jgi:hypothetical protein
MGQYLAIGIMTSVFSSLAEMEKQKVSRKDLRKEMQRSRHFDLNIFDETETKEDVTFLLKDSILESDLVPFLEVFYPKLYPDDSGNREERKECKEIIKKLKSIPSTEYIDLAKQKKYCSFQWDKYAELDYLRIQKDFQPTIQLASGNILLCSEGKIITEGIYGLTSFCQDCIHESFKDHPIAKAVKIYITG